MNKIIEMTFGSHLYGTNTPNSDKDFKGVYMPTREQLLLQRVPKSITSHTRTDHREGVRNSADDVDTEFYSLHYFIHLACEGETVALDMLHAPVKMWTEETMFNPIWEDLVGKRRLFYTKSLKSFVGYARRQAAKYGVKGSRLAEAKRVTAFLASQPASARVRDVWDQLPEGEHLSKYSNEHGRLYNVCGKSLSDSAYCYHYVPMLEDFCNRYGDRARQAEENKGIDWKAVSHAFRAAFQVKHILVDGGYSYPLPETELIMAVKQGVLDWHTQVQPSLEKVMDDIEGLSKISRLPEKVDRAYWDNWLLTVCTLHYASTLRYGGNR